MYSQEWCLVTFAIFNSKKEFSAGTHIHSPIRNSVRMHYTTVYRQYTHIYSRYIYDQKENTVAMLYRETLLYRCLLLLPTPQENCSLLAIWQFSYGVWLPGSKISNKMSSFERDDWPRLRLGSTISHSNTFTSPALCLSNILSITITFQKPILLR